MVEGEQRAVVELRPVATPIPLAFAGLLIASTILSGYELGWIPKAERDAAGWALLGVPFPLQMTAAWWGFAARSAAGATGAAVLAASWLGVGLDLVNAPRGAPGPTSAVGMMAFAAAAALLAPALAELRTGGLLTAAVLILAGARFVCTGVSGLTHDALWAHASGWAGCAVAAAALYGALAFELEGATQRAVLPTFRRGAARAAVVAPLAAQLEAVEHEPGVRKAL